MTEKQLNRYRVIQNLIEGNLKPCEAARALDLSERQIYRLKKGVEDEGVSFLIHKNTNKKPLHTFNDDFKQKIVKLKKTDKYKEANFKHFQNFFLNMKTFLLVTVLFIISSLIMVL